MVSTWTPQSREPYLCPIVSGYAQNRLDALHIHPHALFFRTDLQAVSILRDDEGYNKGMEHLSDPRDSAGMLNYISAKVLQFFTDLPHLQSYYHRNSWCKGRKETMASPSSPEPTLEERINLMQRELDRIKGSVKE